MSDVPVPASSLDSDSLAAVFDALPDAALVFDRRGRLCMTNAAAARFLGRLWQGQTLAEMAAEDPLFSALEAVTAEPDEQRAWVFEAHSERLRRDFSVAVSAWGHAAQGERRYVALLRDITALLDRGRFKDEMLKLASHDLRSPLAIILSYCELIAIEAPESLPGLRHYASVIQTAAERMKTLLDAILRIEEVRSTPPALRPAVNPVDLARAAVNNIHLLAAQKNQQLDADLQPDTAALAVDPLLIQEAMENLIGNAVKYTPDGGHITVRAYDDDAGRFHFQVEDNGIGIGTEHLPRIFESFYRVRQPGTEHIEGSGLGLSLVKSIVERHQGAVWVESAVGAGSRFGFWLPHHTTQEA